MTGPDPAHDGTAVVSVVDRQLTALGAGVEDVVGLDLDALDDASLERVLAADERAIRRLQSHQSRIAAVLTRRRAAQARAERPDDGRAPQKAARQVRTEMTDQLGITPARAKQVARTGRQLEDLPVTRAAHAAGDLTDQHVNVIAEVTAHTSGDDRRQFERELVDLAARCRDAVVFGRKARERLVERDHDAAMQDLQRKKARRSGRVTQTEDGTTLLRLDTAGYTGELVHTVVDAFRTPDAAGDHRTAEQRTHDAICAAFEVALRSGAASTQHGVRPQVALVVRAESVRDGDGAVGTRWTGALPYGEVAQVMGDCALTRIVADATDLPLRVSKRVRTVPAPLWQLLVVRDGGCIWPGCDAPAGWCQVAHLETPFHSDGKLAPDTAGLLCSAGANHHARYDNGSYRVRWVDGRPMVCTSDGQPVAAPGSRRRGGTPDEAVEALRPLGGTSDGTEEPQPRLVREDAGPYVVDRPLRPPEMRGGASSPRAPARATRRSARPPAGARGGVGRRRSRAAVRPLAAPGPPG